MDSEEVPSQGTITGEISRDSFWRTLKLWSQKAHVVNKRLVGISPVVFWRFETNKPSSWTEFVELVLTKLSHKSESDIIEAACRLGWEKSSLWTEDLNFLSISSPSCHVSLRKCLPKQVRRHASAYEFEFINFSEDYAVYVPILEENSSDSLVPPTPYCISFRKSEICIDIYKNDDRGRWILSNVKPKLQKWLVEMEDSGEGNQTKSIRLVPLEAYNELYHQLKEKYVAKLMEIWPECTDPQKFIHEDVAIAAYLMLIWKQDRLDLNLPDDYRPSFLDIGCGNGLLVFLLSSEGFPGRGLDIRSRKLWSLYPPHVDLREETLTPTATTAFPDFDWLLGNHSDELTPWLPVMALNSSIQRSTRDIRRVPTRFWVLPCCPFSFWGKFQRQKNTKSTSRYADYLYYVEKVGRSCGFDVEVDRMRIPSTRRTCLVGKCDEKSAELWEAVRDSINMLLDRESNSGFRPRAAAEPVRNCTKVDREIQDRIVDLTAQHLLESGSADDQWNKGGVLPLSDLVSLLSRDFDSFHSLKKECGGIQTLLKNHSHIFVVQNGSVRFRSPKELSSAEWRAVMKTNKKSKSRPSGEQSKQIKSKKCWFHFHHPQGCPLNQETCRYSH